MRIEELDFRKNPGEVWTCSALPAGRCLLVPVRGLPLYARIDGTAEPFDFMGYSVPYVRDAEDWALRGVVDFGDMAGSLSNILNEAPAATKPSKAPRGRGRGSVK